MGINDNRRFSVKIYQIRRGFMWKERLLKT
jgi:hypothetical protein